MPITHIDAAVYTAQLQEKTSRLQQLLQAFAALEITVFPSPPTHYRMRAEFRLWHDDDDCFYAMTGEDKQLIRVDAFPVACQHINQLMPTLLHALRQSPALRQRLFQVEFLAATTGDCVVTLAYHRALDAAWQEQASSLQHTLGCSIVGRSRGKKVVIGDDFVTEHFCVNGENFSQRQPESAFSQPNAAVNQHMLNWASACCSKIGGDLLELYCGNGNFTLPLSRQFDKVLATEISKTSIHALQHNIESNSCQNIALARLSSEELTQALTHVRPFRRLSHIDLDQYRFTTVLVDPPRAGLDEKTCQLIQQFDNIVYISCNPETLAANLRSLCQTHQITHAALFDQFPYTHHMESGVFLKRRHTNKRHQA